MIPDLLIQNLYETALINPIVRKPALNKLLIVSGYASSAMGFHHLNFLRDENKTPAIELIYGMAKTDGVKKSDHEGFISLIQRHFPRQFSCLYLRSGEAVHSKVYIWCQGNKPLLAFTGSANYTQMALVNSKRREVLTECCPRRAYDYYKALKPDAIDCRDDQVANEISINLKSRYETDQSSQPRRQHPDDRKDPVRIVTDSDSQFMNMETTSVSLIDKNGTVPQRSGLNWGQRPELRRNPDQAYLSLSSVQCRSSFFPPRGVHFTVLTDDNKIFQCVRAQDNGKGIETPHDNSEIGRYIRDRLGIRSGALVEKSDLEKYGRNTIDFYKIDDENFYLDFSR